MSVREREEEERQKNCPSRGLGLAAAAIGVGVGAALYYFFTKRAENPDTAGATSSGWTCEEPLSRHSPSPPPSPPASPDDYTTVSEHSTTDTSMYIESDHDDGHSDSSPSHQSSSSSDTYSTAGDDSSSSSEESSLNNSELTIDSYPSEPEEIENVSNHSEQTVDSYCSEPEEMVEVSDTDELEMLDMDWDVTRNSLDIPRSTAPSVQRSPSPLQRFVTSLNRFMSPRNGQQRAPQDNRMRDQQFRQRSWSLEECSICCEIMLKDQALRQLACSHNFHAACVGPWLEEHQTCPNCRKSA